MSESAGVEEDTNVSGRRGRGSSRVRAKARALECVKGVMEGKTYEQVAEDLGYANRGTVHRIVQQTLARNEAEAVDELRVLELARLDAVQAAFWDAATSGDVKAAEVVLKVMTQRSRLLQLDRAVDTTSTTEALTVGGTKEDYIKALRQGRLESRSLH